MSKLVRFMVGMAAIELLLAGLWYWLAIQPGAGPDTAETLGSMMGGAMGLVLAFGLALFLLGNVARKRSGG
jgi:hypothetical protein